MDRPARTCCVDSHAAKVGEGSTGWAAFLPGVTPWELALRAILIYVALLLALRVFGKREVGQFTLYDLVFILLVANALQPAMTGPDNSIVGGLILILALVFTNFVIARLDRLPRFHNLFSAAPAVIIKDGKYLPDVMRREGVLPAECEMAMREHGVSDIKDVQIAVLEPDGSISIVPTGAAVQRTKRKVRYHRRAG